MRGKWTWRDRFWDSWEHYRVHCGCGRIHSALRALRWEFMGTEAHSGLCGPASSWWTRLTPRYLRGHGPLKKYFWQQEEIDRAKREGEALYKLFGDDDHVEYERRNYP